MSDILLDISFLESLIDVHHENHEQAEKLANHIKDYDLLYIPNHILILIMDKNKQYTVECQKIFDILNNSTRIDCTITKNRYLESFNKYKTLNNLNYNDWLTVTYMKQKNLKYIISFNQKFDNIKGIKRIYKTDPYNRLNYYYS